MVLLQTGHLCFVFLSDCLSTEKKINPIQPFINNEKTIPAIMKTLMLLPDIGYPMLFDKEVCPLRYLKDLFSHDARICCCKRQFKALGLRGLFL